GHDRPQYARTARGRRAGRGSRAALRPLDRGREVPLAKPHERLQAERSGAMSTVTQVQELHREKLRRELGPEVLGWLGDPNVIEIMANPDGRVWLDTLAEGLVDTGVVLSSTQIDLAIGTVAAYYGRVVNEESPRLPPHLPPARHP